MAPFKRHHGGVQGEGGGQLRSAPRGERRRGGGQPDPRATVAGSYPLLAGVGVRQWQRGFKIGVGAPACGPCGTMQGFKSIQTGSRQFKHIRIQFKSLSNFLQSKKDLPWL
jgi:hypothetical protein